MRGFVFVASSAAVSVTLIHRPQRFTRHLPNGFEVVQRKFQLSQSQRFSLGSKSPTTLSNFRLIAMEASRENSQGHIEVPRSVPVRVAHEFHQAGHHYLDVRTPEEFIAGHPVGAINVPYMFKVGVGMSKNPKFLEGVSKRFGKDDEIIVGCQSGKRSLMAAIDLISVGFSAVTDIAGGYSSWSQNGLPTE